MQPTCSTGTFGLISTSVSPQIRVRTNTHTHTQDNYCNPCCTCTPRVNEILWYFSEYSVQSVCTQQYTVEVDKHTNCSVKVLYSKYGTPLVNEVHTLCQHKGTCMFNMYLANISHIG